MNSNQPATPIPNIQQQQGTILVFCLVFLAVLTMVGISGMQSTIMEERMAANMADNERAFNAAESALQAGEAWLLSQDVMPPASNDGSTGVWTADALDPSPPNNASLDDGRYWWEDAAITPQWWASNGLAPANVPAVATQPRYVIEQYKTVNSGQSIGIGSGGTPTPRIVYRITAVGWGGANTTSAMVQSTLVRTYD